MLNELLTPAAQGPMMKRTTHVAADDASSADQARWDAVIARDRVAVGQFVYAVTTTGVYCRPGCPSRRPQRPHVRFFETAGDAAAAGFRPCKRCRPNDVKSGLLPMTDAIRRASAYLAAHADSIVPLRTVAAIAHLSPSHFQRQFKRALGVSPREYQAACRAGRFRHALRSGHDVTAALYEAGYGSPSRVYESSPTGPGMSPATYRRGGAGTVVGFTVVRCALGWLLVAGTAKGVCAVKLGDTAAALEGDLRREFPAATLTGDEGVPAAWVEAVVDRLEGTGDAALPLDVRGTAFQWRVWRALQAIPAGETRTYSEVAAGIAQPSAARAVARACATNPVCLVVPCHRVVGANGSIAGYRWGSSRKRRLLEQEAARAGKTSLSANARDKASARLK